MKISAVICTRDRPALLADCLRTVIAGDYRPREVLVVDQSRDGRTREVVVQLQLQLQDRAADLVYVPTPTRGLSAARNVAVERATGEVLAFTDDDCLAGRGWLSALAEEFGSAAGVAGICGRSLPLLEAPLVANAVSVRTEEVRRLFRAPCSPWRVGSGSNMAFRTAILKTVGPFDERLGAGSRFGGAEDADLIYRLLKRGSQLLYSPRPLVYHRQWRSPSEQLALAQDYGAGIGAFGAKHLLAGDVRAARMLGGWTATTLTDLAGALRARDSGRARAAVRLLQGLASAVLRMALAGRDPAPPAPPRVVRAPGWAPRG